MPVFVEFLLVAFLIYLWESALWLPKRGLVLRRGFFSKSWRVIPATRLFSTRELGLVPMRPIPPDAWIVPCGSFPLAAGEKGSILIESDDGNFHESGAVSWEDIRYSAPYLKAGKRQIRCQSQGVIEALQEGKALGMTPQQTIRRATAQSLTPGRAKRALKRWRIASQPLRLYGPILTIGFFVGLPAAYVFLGAVAALWLSAWLWCLMFAVSLHLFWIAKNIYPTCRAEIRQDAFLSLVVPFHAMRALETISVHAFAATHPAAILIAYGTTGHPWLGTFMRGLLFPRPDQPGDTARAAAFLPALERSLLRKRMHPTDFDTAPDHADDPDAASYCPRCHGMFLAGRETCGDCGDMPLRRF